MIQWWTFQRELERWTAAGRRLDLWWRDDDARTPSLALERLLSLSRRYEAPLTLAVIPDWGRRDLAARLACERQVIAIQHGVDHRNASPSSAPKAEFPLRYPREVMETRLAEAKAQFEVMPRFAPVFSPPWNAIHPDLVPALRATGYRGLSAFGADRSRERGFTRLDVHLGLLDGRVDSPFRGEGRFLSGVAKLARQRRLTGRWDQPIGVLTRHLDHDEGAWRFFETFLDRTTASAAVNWRSIGDLLAADRDRRGVDAARDVASALRFASRGRVSI